MQALQSKVPAKVQLKDNQEIVNIGAHGAATEAIGPYFIQITTSWDKNTKNHKWTTIGMTVEDAKILVQQLEEAIYKRKGVTDGNATFEQIVDSK
jgi:hypothetical protein